MSCEPTISASLVNIPVFEAGTSPVPVVTLGLPAPVISLIGPSAPTFELVLPQTPGLTFFACQNGGGDGSAGVSSLNTLLGDLTVIGAGNISVSTDGNSVIYVSGNNVGGAVTQSQLDSLSGWTTNNLNATGLKLYALVTGLSGSNGQTYATIANLTQSGIILGAKIDSLSGFALGISGYLASLIGAPVVVSGYITTGQADLRYYPLSVNPSGYLNTFSGLSTGYVLGASGSLHSEITGASGYLKTLIAGSIGGVSSINGQSGVLSIVGLGSITVTTGVGNIFISGATGVAGGVTQAQLDSVSGWTAANLTATGTVLQSNLTGASGYIVSLIPAPTSVSGYITTGQADQRYYPLLSNPSGYLTTLSGLSISYVTGISGGLQAEINALLANLGLTGSFLFLRDSGISGALAAQIGSFSIPSGIVYVTGDQTINGTKTFQLNDTSYLVVNSGGNNIAVFSPYGLTVNSTNGHTSLDTTNYVLNGSNGQTSVNWASRILEDNVGGISVTWDNRILYDTSSHGSIGWDQRTLFNSSVVGTLDWNALKLIGEWQTNASSWGSGIVVNVFRLSGVSGVLQSQINALPTSIQLAQTGQALLSLITSASGTLQTQINSIGSPAATGALLYQLITGMSGSTQIQIASTGSQAWNTANSNAINLSGNLFASGAAIGGQLTSLSGFVIGTSGSLQTQIAITNANLVSTGTFLSAVRVTGSSVINSPNFTGLGGTIVRQSGNFILISGAGTAGLAGVSSINGLVGGISVTGTGNVTIVVAGSTLIVSGDTGAYVNFATVANLALTGQQAWGAAQSNAISLSGNLTLTGISLLANIINNGTNLSGNLATTGTTLSNRINTLSGFVTGYVSVTPNQRVTGGFTMTPSCYRYFWSGASIGTGILPTASSLSGYNFIVKNLTTGINLFVSGSVDYYQNTLIPPLSAFNFNSDGGSWIIL